MSKIIFSHPQPIDPESIIISQELKELQGYMPISPDDFNTLQDDIKKNGIRDPLKVCIDKDHNTILLGGMNRLEIAKGLKLKNIPVIYGQIEGNDLKPLSKTQRRDIVWQDNLSRRHLTTAQKKNLITYLLENNPSASSRSIAKILGMSHHTVEKTRQEMTGQIAQSERKGQDGRVTKTQAGQKKKPVNNSGVQNEHLKTAKEQQSTPQEPITGQTPAGYVPPEGDYILIAETGEYWPIDKIIANITVLFKYLPVESQDEVLFYLKDIHNKNTQ